MQNAMLDETQAGINTAQWNTNNLRNADDTTLMTESEKELKSLLMNVKDESENLDLKTQNSENEDHGIQSHHCMANRCGNNGNSDRLYFLALQNHRGQWLQPWKEKTLATWEKSYDQPRQHVKKQRYYFADKGPSSQRYRFSSSHVWMWELDWKESCRPKHWCFWTVVLEKTLESPLDCSEIQAAHPKGNQSWTFIGRTDVATETPNTSATCHKELTC